MRLAEDNCGAKKSRDYYNTLGYKCHDILDLHLLKCYYDQQKSILFRWISKLC